MEFGVDDALRLRSLVVVDQVSGRSMRRQP